MKMNSAQINSFIEKIKPLGAGLLGACIIGACIIIGCSIVAASIGLATRESMRNGAVVPGILGILAGGAIGTVTIVVALSSAKKPASQNAPEE